jgi:hypothetical protein
MPIRPTGRTARSERADRGSNPRWAATPPRTAAAPLSYCGRPGSAPGGGSMCSYSNSGREGGLRSRQLRVRLPPSTPRIWRQIRACLVATASTPPRYGGSRGSTPSSAIFRLFAPGGRAVVSRRVNLPGLQAPPRKRLGVSSVVVRFHLSPRLKSMEGAPPARQRALKARAVIRPRGSTPPPSAPRARPSWLKGPL